MKATLEPLKQASDSLSCEPIPVKDQDYWNALDGVRALAVVLVLLHHVGPYPAKHLNVGTAFLNQICYWGWAGVDIFFVLSGFLITFLLLKEWKKTDGISIKNFYVRRCLRIWPLYYLVLLIAFIVVPTFAPVPPPQDTFKSFLLQVGLPFVLFVGNYSLLLDRTTIVTFEGQLRLSAPWIVATLAPLWSLAIEEQFYLVWPWVIKRVTETSKLVALLLVAWAATGMVRLITIAFLPAPDGTPLHYWYYMNTVARLDPLMLGALLAVIVSQAQLERLVTRKVYRSIAVATLLATAVLLAYFPPIQCATSVHFFTFLLISLIGVGLTLLSLTPGPVRSFFSSRILTFIGRRSYAFYLFHNVVITFVASTLMPLLHPNRPTTAWIYLLGISFTATLLLSQLSRILIEQPLLKLRTKFQWKLHGETQRESGSMTLPVLKSRSESL